MDQSLDTFQQWLKERGLKATSQRDDIARVFFASERHISVEELYAEVKKVNPRVGYATVYRTLRLLKECGLAAERHFNDGEARYERAESEKRPHDHFICERCNRIVEFSSPENDALHQGIASRLGFVITRHRLELYGICRECREGNGRRSSSHLSPSGRGRPKAG
ncbi:MAG: Fur family transcriptional regulator [Candidatus Binatia bacterium]